ncbi:uncharacterized protein [Littorina saxatilis]|uniref:Uncharacterized protein n=1 Tax=Littorina saxatilis TaxID=31220 RepID=A0AAN9GCB1_9CAEN
MKIFVLGVFLAAFAAVCLAEVGMECTNQSQCAPEECCQIINNVVASKKRLVFPGFRQKINTSGTCQNYSQQGASCTSFATMNGYCGCADGLSCKTVRVSKAGTPIKHVLVRRKMAPGYRSFCLSN